MNNGTILKTGIFQCENDVMDLNIFDVHRSKSNPFRTIRGIAGWLQYKAKFTVLQIDLNQSPVRDDFPGWSHVGGHPEMGHLYWNWFHDQFSDIVEKELVLSDSPDLQGFITFPDEGDLPQKRINFWGDIGRVSSDAFTRSIVQMGKGDFWITVHEHKQIVIESLVDLFDLYCQTIS